jgi:8-oxo-dGTP pyrophosphatase MutT (NUDIX family)
VGATHSTGWGPRLHSRREPEDALMRWTVHGEEVLYESSWVRLVMTDIEIPGGERFGHHVVRTPAPAAGTVVFDPERGVLLLWRHRFITDTWGWEIPAGRVDEGESPERAAAREALEETGWRPGPVRWMTTYFPNNGLTDSTFHLYQADGATYVGEPTDPSESERVEWLTLDRLNDEIRGGRIGDGLSLTALLWWLQFERPGGVEG